MTGEKLTRKERRVAQASAQGADADTHARTRTLLTPEGVPIRIRVASLGDRAAAFLIDLAIIFGLGIGLVLVIGLGGRSYWAFTLLIVFIFLLRSFYFVFFELRGQGRTPGKKRLGLRVIDRRGGPLTTEAVFIRNIVREVEFFVPLAAVLSPEQIWPGSSGLGGLIAVSWLLILALLPYFNRDRLRFGDLAAGTMVVEQPRVTLLDDLSAPAFGPAPTGLYLFEPRHLDHYGVYELQVLETLLRSDSTTPETWALVCGRVAARIGWDGPLRDQEAFLRAFYAAQRARLEHQMRLGKRRERKGLP